MATLGRTTHDAAFDPEPAASLENGVQLDFVTALSGSGATHVQISAAHQYGQAAAGVHARACIWSFTGSNHTTDRPDVLLDISAEVTTAGGAPHETDFTLASILIPIQVLWLVIWSDGDMEPGYTALANGSRYRFGGGVNAYSSGGSPSLGNAGTWSNNNLLLDQYVTYTAVTVAAALPPQAPLVL